MSTPQHANQPGFVEPGPYAPPQSPVGPSAPDPHSATAAWTPPPPKSGSPVKHLVGYSVAVLAALVFGFGAGVASSQDSSSTSSAKAPSSTAGGAAPAAVESEVPEAPALTPDDIVADVSCDYLLAEGLGDDHKLIASAYVSNEAQADAVVQITATWRQSGGKPISQSKKITLAAGAKDIEVQFEKPANGRVIDRLQAVPTDKQCDLTMDLING